eukprot:TRINITY_DN9251_c0_g1_i1.p2 TRINITY_DN9251_c0_g1~~TRINITY_DN9251_c0_g1_i1.p2  ORF type:complete len:138 (+),score=32.47 TRINITY_DN9251_c0_g1_i1:330-743(+)
MDDDELVMAYVTPPASMASPVSAPSARRPSSEKRRRAAESRDVRAAVAAAAARGSGSAAPPVPPPVATLTDVFDAMRNGSLGAPEMSRLRAEIVVIKSKAASSLRHIDGLATAADGRDSRADAVLGRLGDWTKPCGP